MKITKIHMRNICQHADLKVDMSSGLCAVTAPNGSGKTNFVRAAMYGITGIVDGAWGSQTDLQKDGEIAVGWVKIFLTVDDGDYCIQRFAATSTSNPDLLWQITDGKEELKANKRSTVDKFVQEHTGVSVQLLSQILWARQGTLGWLLKSTSATISTFLALVFNTKRLEKQREALKLGMDGVAQLRSDFDSRESTAVENLNALLDPDADRLTSLRTDMDKVRSSIAQLERSLAGVEDIKTLTDVRNRLSAALAATKEELGTIQEPEGPVEKPTETVVDTNNSIRQLNAIINDTTSTRASYLSDIRVDKNKLVSAEKWKAAAASDMDVYKAIGSSTVCEFCGGKVEDEKAYMQAKLQARFGSSDAKEVEGRVTKALTDAEADIDRINKDLTRLDLLVQDCDKSIKENNETLSQWTAVRDQWTAYNIIQRKIELTSLVELRSNEISKCTKKITEAKAHSKKTEQLAVLKAQQAAYEKEERDLITAMASYSADKARYEQEIEICKKDREEYQKNEGIRETLIRLRDILSQSRAQARFMRGNIRRLNELLVRYTELTDLPFTVYLDEQDTVFRYQSADGFTHPAGHLSGAQESMAAVILQLSLLSVIGPKISILFTDEPDTACDTPNVMLMSRLFRDLNNLMLAEESTMLIITRSEPLISECGNTIRLVSE